MFNNRVYNVDVYRQIKCFVSGLIIIIMRLNCTVILMEMRMNDDLDNLKENICST